MDAFSMELFIVCLSVFAVGLLFGMFNVILEISRDAKEIRILCGNIEKNI